jgi:serine/threonine-protein kinase
MSEPDDGDRPAEGLSLDPELEGVLDQMVRDWNSGTPRPLRSYLDHRPGLIDRPGIILELINQEAVLRQLRGETPRPADYLVEFPELSGSLDRLFEVLALGSGRQPPLDGTMVVSPSGGPIGVRPAGVRLPEIPGYEIERLLGRGGMGVVYLARHLGLNRRVAVKLLRESRQDDPGLVARFRREAEAAARCQHPNLVQIHEIGEHAGVPYLALEYVAGGHLGRELAGEPRPPIEAAGLVETLARAIDHAHAQGVVHRDLKPANVLLTPDGQPKITDFGLAKLRDSTTETEVGTMLGTLAYMAPEQVRADSGDIGPRADIHALGAILYEALTGRPPYRAETPQRVFHAILNEEVVPPSSRRPGVPRDLEAICRKCLEKEPARRYATAADLAEDLRRFLDGRPTEARPPSTVERCGRWCGRNRWAVAAIAALLLLTALAGWQAARATMAERVAQSEAGLARAVNDFLTEDILGRASSGIAMALDPSLASEVKVRTALDIATEKIGARFEGRPLVEAAIRLAIGRSYEQLGLREQAATQLARAVELRSRVLGADDPQTLIAECRLGLVLVADREVEAERHLRRALDGLHADGAARPEELLALQGLGALAISHGRLDEGRERLSRAFNGLRAARGPAHPETLDVTRDLALLLQKQGKLEEARRLVEESYRLVVERPGVQPPDALDARFRLAHCTAELDDIPGAIRLLEAIVPEQERLVGKGHADTLQSMAILAQFYHLDGRYDDAEPLLLRALPECRRSFDRNHAVTGVVLAELAAHYAHKKDLEKLRESLVEALDITRARFGLDNGWTALGSRTIADMYLITPQHAAERYLRDYLAFVVREGSDPAERVLTEGKLGLCQLARKADRAAGEVSMRRAADWIATRMDEVPPLTRTAFRGFANLAVRAYDEAGDPAQAGFWKLRRMDLDFPGDPCER